MELARRHEKHGPRFDCVIDQDGAILTIMLSGDVDLATVERLEEDIDFGFDGGERLVVLDLASVEFIDSTGLRLLLQLKRKAEEQGARMLIGRLSQPVKRLLDLTKLTSRFEFLDGLGDVQPVCPVCERPMPNESARCPSCGAVF
jgi:anti-anti-sigma factor